MEKGILTSNSAGNNGPRASTVTSVAPWLLTVAASTTDRRMIDKVVLGNGTTVVGASVNSFQMTGTSFPLIYGKDATTQCLEFDARKLCYVTSHMAGIDGVYQSGSLGSILRVGWDDDLPIFALPATTLSDKEYNMIKSYYMNSTKDPQVNILKSEAERDAAADSTIVASFSSRGPNQILPEIIKPDISAPGVAILAAYSPIASITDNPEDKRHVNYSILSGTSMSCPHATGATAYV
ncbi:putative cucumisin [Rosa chinensis]|uniref:Putative cucumisin n=1 Tax=Rosa chinensis TaxID=74649 RepID=A0A2P6S9I3_ROSCH|nr:putative cucumisin [Rosa chinensis]